MYEKRLCTVNSQRGKVRVATDDFGDNQLKAAKMDIQLHSYVGHHHVGEGEFCILSFLSIIMIVRKKKEDTYILAKGFDSSIGLRISHMDND